jgi:hypothetical protein
VNKAKYTGLTPLMVANRRQYRDIMVLLQEMGGKGMCKCSFYLTNETVLKAQGVMLDRMPIVHGWWRILWLVAEFMVGSHAYCSWVVTEFMVGGRVHGRIACLLFMGGDRVYDYAQCWLQHTVSNTLLTTTSVANHGPVTNHELCHQP